APHFEPVATEIYDRDLGILGQLVEPSNRPAKIVIGGVEQLRGRKAQTFERLGDVAGIVERGEQRRCTLVVAVADDESHAILRMRSATPWAAKRDQPERQSCRP